MPSWLPLSLVPFLYALLLGLIVAAVEWRLRVLVGRALGTPEERAEKEKAKEKDIEDRREKIKFDLRTEFQKPIGELGLRIMELERAVAELSRRVERMSAQVDLFWNMIEQSTAGMLLRKQDEKSKG